MPAQSNRVHRLVILLTWVYLTWVPVVKGQPYQWAVGEWSACSQANSCQHTRTIQCYDFALGGGSASDLLCTETAPTTTEQCYDSIDCATPTPTISPTPTPTFSTPVPTVVPMDTPAPTRMPTGIPSMPPTRSPTADPTEKSGYRWAVGTWSSCSVTCGSGTRSRTVRCFKHDSITLSTTEAVDSLCLNEAYITPVSTETCEDKLGIGCVLPLLPTLSPTSEIYQWLTQSPYTGSVDAGRAGRTACSAGSTQGCVCAEQQGWAPPGTQTCRPDGYGFSACSCAGVASVAPGRLAYEACTPKTMRTCSCGGGYSGQQACRSDGGGYWSCYCLSAPLPSTQVVTPQCSGGTYRLCNCGSGSQGTQYCLSDGSGYLQCECSSTGPPVSSVCLTGESRSCECVDGSISVQSCLCPADATRPSTLCQFMACPCPDPNPVIPTSAPTAVVSWVEDTATMCGLPGTGTCPAQNGAYIYEGQRYQRVTDPDDCKPTCRTAGEVVGDKGCGGFDWIPAGQPHSGGINKVSDDGKGACYFRLSTTCSTAPSPLRKCYTKIVGVAPVKPVVADTIFNKLSEYPSLSTLVTGISACSECRAALESRTERFTVFAPTNDAFSELPTGTVNALIQPSSASQLKMLLMYHTVRATLSSSGLKSGTTIPTILYIPTISEHAPLNVSTMTGGITVEVYAAGDDCGVAEAKEHVHAKSCSKAAKGLYLQGSCDASRTTGSLKVYFDDTCKKLAFQIDNPGECFGLDTDTDAVLPKQNARFTCYSGPLVTLTTMDGAVSASIVEADIVAGNGLIHIIDSVLKLPKITTYSTVADTSCSNVGDIAMDPSQSSALIVGQPQECEARCTIEPNCKAYQYSLSTAAAECVPLLSGCKQVTDAPSNTTLYIKQILDLEISGNDPGPWVIPAATNPPTRLPSTYPPTMPPTPLLPETSLPTVEEIDITLVPSVLPEPSRAISQHAVLASAFIPVAVSFCVILGCQ